MGKIRAIFNIGLAAVLTGNRQDGITPVDIMQVFGYLPGNTTIDSIVKNPIMVSICVEYKIEATNDTLPDGTEIIAKYRRDAWADPNSGQVKQFSFFDGITVNYPNQQGQAFLPGNNAKLPPSISPLVVPSGAPPIAGVGPKCSCGAAKMGSSGHSNWCDANP